MQTTVDRYGRMDFAFNNAAALSKLGRLADYSEQDFDVEVTLNLKSVWLCMKAELEIMQKQEPSGGAIVNTSSVNGLEGARGAALYSMSKAGLLALTKSAAQEYAKAGIRIKVSRTQMSHTSTSLLRPLWRSCRSGQQATVNIDLGPGDVGRFVRSEEYSNGSNLIDSAEALKRSVLHDSSDSLLTIRSRTQHRFPHGREDGGRMDRIATNAPPLFGAVESD